MPMPRVPRSLMRADRQELTGAPLVVHEGSLPADLRGHVFVVAPVGTIERPRPSPGATSVTVGDGLVSRFDFDGGGARVTTRLIRTPDFVADELTRRRPDLHAFRFVSSGLLRIGLLGTRDFANTALVPMQAGAGPARMLATFDAGRPVEIDPASLAFATSVGARDEWRAETLAGAAFPVVLSPAHPAYDSRTGELFTLNYGRSAASFARTVPIVNLLSRAPSLVADLLERAAGVAGDERALRHALHTIDRGLARVDRWVERFTDRKLHFVPDTFTDLVRWKGDGALERFRLVLPNGDEVAIEQSVHQVAVTREHVVVLETGFKIGLASAFNDPVPHGDVIDRALRAALTRPQLPHTVFYVVRRGELARADLPKGDDGVRCVAARRVEIPLEADHFLADYDDAQGIVLHVAHAPATDLGEWIRPYDQSPFGLPHRDDLDGMMAVGAMDVGRFGRYVIDGASGRVLEAGTTSDDELSWAISLYAGAAINTGDPLPEKIDRLWWCTEGVFPELLTETVFDLYEHYPHRLVPTSRILAMRDGRPSAIVRLDTEGPRVADSCLLPHGVMAGSMQHVPGDGRDLLVCTVYTDERAELWVLDGGDLRSGPLCKLHCDAWIVGFSLHTAYLPAIEARTASYRVDTRSELAPHVEDPALRAALEEELYPRFE